jgi:hypothetical protein
VRGFDILNGVRVTVIAGSQARVRYSFLERSAEKQSDEYDAEQQMWDERVCELQEWAHQEKAAQGKIDRNAYRFSRVEVLETALGVEIEFRAHLYENNDR